MSDASTRQTPPKGYPSPSIRDAAPKASVVALVGTAIAAVGLMLTIGAQLYASRAELVAVATSQKATDESLRVMRADNEARIKELRSQGDAAMQEIKTTFRELAAEIRSHAPRKRSRDE